MDLDELKNKIMNGSVDILISSLERGEINETDITPIADFILSRIDSVNSKEDADRLISELSVKWPMFNGLVLDSQAEEQKKRDNEIAQNALHLAQDGKIDEALSLAKNATQENQQ